MSGEIKNSVKETTESKKPPEVDLNLFSQQASDFADSCVRDSMGANGHLKKIEDAIKSLSEKKEMQISNVRDLANKVFEALIRGHRIGLCTRSACLRWQCFAVNVSEDQIEKYKTQYEEKILESDDKTEEYEQSIIKKISDCNNTICILELYQGIKMDKYKDHIIKDAKQRFWRRVDVAQDVNMLCHDETMLQIACMYVDCLFPINLLNMPAVKIDGDAWWELLGSGEDGGILKEEFLHRYKELKWHSQTQQRKVSSLNVSEENNQILVAAMEDTACVETLHNIAHWHVYAIPFHLNTLFLDIPTYRDAYALLANHRLLYRLFLQNANIPHTLGMAYAITRFRENNLLPNARRILTDTVGLNYSNINAQLQDIICGIVTYRNPDVSVTRHVFDTIFHGQFDLERYHKIFTNPDAFRFFFGASDVEIEARNKWTEMLYEAKRNYDGWEQKNSFQNVCKRKWQIKHVNTLGFGEIGGEDGNFIRELLEKSAQSKGNKWISFQSSTDLNVQGFLKAVSAKKGRDKPLSGSVFERWTANGQKSDGDHLWRQNAKNPLSIQMKIPETEKEVNHLQDIMKQFTPKSYIRIPESYFESGDDGWIFQIENMPDKPISVCTIDHLIQKDELNRCFDISSVCSGTETSKWYAVPDNYWNNDQLVAISTGTTDDFGLTKTVGSNAMIWGNFKRKWVRDNQNNVRWAWDIELADENKWDRSWWLEMVKKDRCISDVVLKEHLGDNWAEKWPAEQIIDFGLEGHKWKKSTKIDGNEDNTFNTDLPWQGMRRGFYLQEFFDKSKMNVEGRWEKIEKGKLQELQIETREIKEIAGLKKLRADLDKFTINTNSCTLREDWMWKEYGIFLSDLRVGDYIVFKSQKSKRKKRGKKNKTEEETKESNDRTIEPGDESEEPGKLIFTTLF